MDNLVFVAAHPDIPYFHWQTKVYTHNFIEKGIKPENIHVLFVMVNGNTQPSEESLKMKDLGINVHHYLDDRKEKRYIPSLRPLALSRWLKENPHLSKLYFYHDSDIVFRELPDFEKLIFDDLIYISDTLSYINYDYVISCCERYENVHKHLRKNELFELMVDTIGVTNELVKINNQNSGGAQYLLKNVGYEFWEKVYDDCTKLYFNIFEFHKKNPIYPGEIQMWTADMWALLWNLWYFGLETRISDDISFSWATDNLQTYEKHNILHMAGVTDNLKHTMFYKGEFINVSPLDKLKENTSFFDYIDKNSATTKYVEIMKRVVEKDV